MMMTTLLLFMLAMAASAICAFLREAFVLLVVVFVWIGALECGLRALKSSAVCVWVKISGCLLYIFSTSVTPYYFSRPPLQRLTVALALMLLLLLPMLLFMVWCFKVCACAAGEHCCCCCCWCLLVVWLTHLLLLVWLMLYLVVIIVVVVVVVTTKARCDFDCA